MVNDDGASGFIVRDIDEAAAAVRRLGELDRGVVSHSFERRFMVQRMAENYLAIYRQLPGVCQERVDLQLTADGGANLRAVA